MSKAKTPQEKMYWQDLWHRALGNVGSKAALMVILEMVKDKKYGSQQFSQKALRGIRPRDPRKQELLKQLAGPHGRTIGIIICKRRNLKFRSIS